MGNNLHVTYAVGARVLCSSQGTHFSLREWKVTQTKTNVKLVSPLTNLVSANSVATDLIVPSGKTGHLCTPWKVYAQLSLH